MNQDSVVEEWVPAAQALDVLGMTGLAAKRTICKRAHAGIIRAKAKLFIADGTTRRDFQIPPGFWWAEGEAALEQNWSTGDFETWIDRKHRIRAFGVAFSRSDLEDARPYQPSASIDTLTSSRKESTPKGTCVFIGHGRSMVWRELKEFLKERLKLDVEEFNSTPTAGITTVDRLSEMLSKSAFAFLILTGEDEQSDNRTHARLNVVHEVGLFQGRLGFEKAIVLLEGGCEEFSNIHGLGQIRFPKGHISTAFEEIRRVLEREKIIAGSNFGVGI